MHSFLGAIVYPYGYGVAESAGCMAAQAEDRRLYCAADPVSRAALSGDNAPLDKGWRMAETGRLVTPAAGDKPVD